MQIILACRVVITITGAAGVALNIALCRHLRKDESRTHASEQGSQGGAPRSRQELENVKAAGVDAAGT